MTTLEVLRREAARCERCELFEPATRTVFGQGPASAWLVLVGEQPGDREDLEGAPFVGPAGRLLDTALGRSGIDRGEVYVTNAVKHFRFERSGNRRLHKTPAVGHVRACRAWLDGELAVVAPAVVVTLGATAGKALLGPAFRITAERGRPRDWEGRLLVPTTHPSAILRGPAPERDAALDAFVADLTVAAALRPEG
ncbi:UdgX family uracil-DNA binding protein [Pseudonocardia sp.]|uniref:UdgX family uracil-DNA binding protein n=1 Tax=Pseudonocardia sp. TaxID=60912 RepID=UPI002617331A|nr:UdgX family uracil-DNA binding protein [Pseudonocardia sp.]